MKKITYKTIEKAVGAINQYYDTVPNGYINEEYLIAKNIADIDNVHILISQLEGLELIRYGTNDYDVPAINRLSKCKSYLIERKERRKDIIITRIISIAALALSAIAIIMRFLPL